MAVSTADCLSVATAEEYGREIPLTDLLHLVGSICPSMDKLGNDPCGAHHRDLAQLRADI
jgi:hypothetical protein